MDYCHCYTPVHLKEECVFRRQTPLQMEENDKKNPYRGEKGEFMKRYNKPFVPYDWSGPTPYCMGCIPPIHKKEECIFRDLNLNKIKGSK